LHRTKTLQLVLDIVTYYGDLFLILICNAGRNETYHWK